MRKSALLLRAAAAPAAALCLAAALSAGPARAGESTVTSRTNLEMAKEAVRGAVREALETFPPADAPVRLVALARGDIDPIVEAVLVEELSARGVPLEVQAGTAPLAAALGDSGAAEPAAVEGGAGEPGDPADGLQILSYRVTDFSFRYADVYRKYLLGPRHIRRLARADLHLRLSEPSGRNVIWSRNASHSTMDDVGYGEASLLESNAYAFAKPERQPSTLARLYEPLIVGGIVAGLVFLFYSNQSGG